MRPCQPLVGTVYTGQWGFSPSLSAPPGPGREDFTPAGEVHHHRGEGVYGV